jgi:hypothetical protein
MSALGPVSVSSARAGAKPLRDAFNPNLAALLNKPGQSVGRRGRREEEIAAIEEAADLVGRGRSARATGVRPGELGQDDVRPSQPPGHR